MEFVFRGHTNSVERAPAIRFLRESKNVAPHPAGCRGGVSPALTPSNPHAPHSQSAALKTAAPASETSPSNQWQRISAAASPAALPRQPLPEPTAQTARPPHAQLTPPSPQC